jgi:hypothetical protein
VTVVGLTLPTLIAGTAIFESIFTLPGMGRYLVSSVSSLDYPVIMGVVLLRDHRLANLAVDLSYTVLDPGSGNNDVRLIGNLIRRFGPLAARNPLPSASCARACASPAANHSAPSASCSCWDS